ncbi:hypothetical protein [Galliscardovia ingluviei]|uniref:hypothetical protein n=1 Tax=Galliscardovia ingluviei TaxID=1769422 RepID=UPI00166DC5CD|nr:hypothetical protein [Galliscardovia ingluviei]
MRHRIIALLASFALSFSVAIPSITVYADEPDYSTSVQNTTLPAPKESDYKSSYGERSIITQIAKRAIRFIIKHKGAAANVVERISGRKAADTFIKHFDEISSAISPLLQWSDLPAQAVYDAVFRALVDASVPRETAAKVALAIKEGLSWFI